MRLARSSAMRMVVWLALGWSPAAMSHWTDLSQRRGPVRRDAVWSMCWLAVPRTRVVVGHWVSSVRGRFLAKRASGKRQADKKGARTALWTCFRLRREAQKGPGFGGLVRGEPVVRSPGWHPMGLSSAGRPGSGTRAVRLGRCRQTPTGSAQAVEEALPGKGAAGPPASATRYVICFLSGGSLLAVRQAPRLVTP